MVSILHILHLINPLTQKVTCKPILRRERKTYLDVHSEIPVNSVGPIEESIPIIGEAAIHMTTRIEVSTHGFSFPSSLNPGDAQAFEHIKALKQKAGARN
jgi:hypothetical protein